MNQLFRRFASLGLAAAAVLPAGLQAQENLELGKMWTFENPPLGYLKDEYGFAPTQEWLDALRLASIRFGGGCSSSFVSPQGLIMTNHHCMRGEIVEVQGDNDWLNNGFYAAALEDEVKVPGLTVQQLVSMKDVTEEMNRGIEASDGDATVTIKRDANERAIMEAARAADPDLKPQVVTLYQGAVYQLYSYKVYDDIRLVCAPHLQTAHFGGDPDNFTYPRYGIDFGFCRAYEDDKPADTSAHYFKWNTTGLLENDLVFVTGNPGTTKRLLTYAQLEYMRDVWHPIVNEMIDRKLEIRQELATKDPAIKRELEAEILSYQNSQKALRGYLSGLLDPSLMAQKKQAEKAFRTKVDADPALAQQYGDTWDKIEAVTERRAEVERLRRFQSTAGHPVLQIGLMLLQNRHEDAVKEAGVEVTALQHSEFIDHLTRASKWLENEELDWIGVGTPTEIAEAVRDSRLRDASYVRELIEGGEEAIANSTDVAMVMASKLLPCMLENGKVHQEVLSIEKAQGARIGQALHAVYGNKVSPDATFTLRFSDGVAKGYAFNGTVAPWRTSFYGLYGRNAAFDNKYPFNLPQPWLDRRERVDMTKAVDFVSTNDIIGGNSGSPIVNKDLEVVGLVFDGNIEMLPNRYLYRGDIPRSVSVHVDAIMESLAKIYDAQRIVDELTK